MKDRISALACIIAATLASTSAQAAPSPKAAPVKPYALRGVELGITLDAFKAFPVPADGHLNPHYACDDQPLPDRHSFWDGGFAEGVHVITCEWFYNTADMPKMINNHFVDLGLGKGAPTFRFIQQNGQWRLFQITAYASDSYYSGILDALKRNYGPGRTTVEPFTTRAGTSFSNTITVWSNAVSSIRLKQRDLRVDRYRLTYRHEALSRTVEDALAKIATNAAGKI